MGHSQHTDTAKAATRPPTYEPKQRTDDQERFRKQALANAPETDVKLETNIFEPCGKINAYNLYAKGCGCIEHNRGIRRIRGMCGVTIVT